MISRKEKARFDSLVVYWVGAAKKAFARQGHDEAEDMSQELAASLSAARPSIMSDDDMEGAVRREVSSIAFQIHKEASSRRRGLRLMDIEAASGVADVANPYHFLIAKEIAEQAVRNDLDSILMGDTLEEEAQHYGVSRQRAHQITNEKRSHMADYLIH